MAKLFGKVALITGSSKGVGAATAKMFSSLGCYLALTGRNLEEMNSVATECLVGLPPEKVLIIPGNLDNVEDIDMVLEKTINHFGQLDILVHASSDHGKNDGLMQATIEDFDTIMDINIRGIFYLTKVAMPHLMKTQGCILITGCIFGIKCPPEALLYGMSQAAINMFTKSVAKDMEPHSIRVNSVCPSYIGPSLVAHHKCGKKKDEVLKKLDATHPSGRLATAEDVANIFSFLASDEGKLITGAIIPLDGGFIPDLHNPHHYQQKSWGLLKDKAWNFG